MTSTDDVDHTGGFGIDHLPYGSIVDRQGRRFAAVRYGDGALDLTALWAEPAGEESGEASAGLFTGFFTEGTLDRFIAAGPRIWAAVRAAVTRRLTDPADRGARSALIPLADTTAAMPIAVGDYVDFYASEHHASNVGRIFRPGGEPLTENWRHLPVGYHGRAGTVVVSGTDIARPRGQFKQPDGTVHFGPTRRLDFEAEVGFVVGRRTALGDSIPVGKARDHLFGICLVNDWSARDIQAFEYVPLGPFLGKSFATSISGWITPLAALDRAWADPPARTVPLLPYLDDAGLSGGLDIAITVAVNGTVVSRPPFASMYWTAAQMLAHLSVNGASVRPGDLFASGTVSGPGALEQGSLLELTTNGSRPLLLDEGRELGFLADGDEVVLTATAAGASSLLELGQCRGRIRAGRVADEAVQGDGSVRSADTSRR